MTIACCPACKRPLTLTVEERVKAVSVRCRLTPKQAEVVQMILQSQDATGFAPTLEEMAEKLDVRKVCVFEHVNACVAKGAIVKVPNVSRGLKVVE